MRVDERPLLGEEAAVVFADVTNAASLRLLGGFELRVGTRPVTLSLGPQRLLAYLALHGRPTTRSSVAGTLWPEAAEDRAAANLRSTLWRIRRTGLPLVSSSGAYLRLEPSVRLDVHESIGAARRILNAAATGADLDALPDVALAGDVLPDWDDDWALLERERFRQIRLHALERRCDLLRSAGRTAEAIESALAVVAAEPLRESAHRALIRAHLAEGNRVEALRQFALYRRLMRDELGLEPSPDVSALLGTAAAAVTRS
jgi:DNA-binding SARP family transcriptional activator